MGSPGTNSDLLVYEQCRKNRLLMSTLLNFYANPQKERPICLELGTMGRSAEGKILIRFVKAMTDERKPPDLSRNKAAFRIVLQASPTAMMQASARLNAWGVLPGQKKEGWTMSAAGCERLSVSSASHISHRRR